MTNGKTQAWPVTQVPHSWAQTTQTQWLSVTRQLGQQGKQLLWFLLLHFLFPNSWMFSATDVVVQCNGQWLVLDIGHFIGLHFCYVCFVVRAYIVDNYQLSDMICLKVELELSTHILIINTFISAETSRHHGTWIVEFMQAYL